MRGAESDHDPEGRSRRLKTLVIPFVVGIVLAGMVCVADPYLDHLLKLSVMKVDNIFTVAPYPLTIGLVVASIGLFVLFLGFRSAWESERFRLALLIFITQFGFLPSMVDPFYGIGATLAMIFFFQLLIYRKAILLPTSFVFPLQILLVSLVWLSGIVDLTQITWNGILIATWTILVWVLMIINHVRSRDDFYRCLDFLCWATLFSTFIGLIQFVVWLKFHLDLTLTTGGVMEQYESGFEYTPWGVLQRAAGFFNHPNHYGAFLGAVIIIFIYTGLSKTLPRRRRTFYLVTSAIASVSLVLSFSRTAWMGVAAALVLVPYFWRPSRAVVYTLVLVLIMAAGLGTHFFQNAYDLTEEKLNPGAVEARLDVYELAYQAFVTHPLTGVGINNFDVYPGNIMGYKAHNMMLQLLSEIGILGCVTYLTLMVLVQYRLFRAWLAAREERDKVVFAALFLGMFSYFVHAQFDILLFGNILWLCVGLSESAIFTFGGEAGLAAAPAAEPGFFPGWMHGG